MLSTALWAAGILFAGGGGLWIAALFLPTVATLLASALNFAKSPIGMVLAIGALVMFAFSSAWVGGDLHGTNTTRAEWRADTAVKAKVAADREAALRSEMQTLADAGLKVDGEFGKQIDNEVSTNVAKAPKRLECRASGDDVERLLSVH
jgi:hypothetical protein